MTKDILANARTIVRGAASKETLGREVARKIQARLSPAELASVLAAPNRSLALLNALTAKGSAK